MTPGQPQWKNDVLITIQSGQIVQVCAESAEKNGIRMPGVAIPAIANVHSHAFQRGFAGLSEFRTAANDSFWTWRKLMYDFVETLTPADVFVIARQLYLEMIAVGYSWVGEFHYLHNAPQGQRYANGSEMSDAVLRAAHETGIGICLLPVLYQRSGFDAATVSRSQQRFALDDDDYFRLLENCRKRISDDPNATVAMAFHSLRAVSREVMNAALEFRNGWQSGCPVHIHIAEQTLEVDDCLKATGRRSVEYLLSEFNVDRDWCLIHATHMDQSETESLAESGAVVGLCPTTEANLGDGFFSAQEFMNRGGVISVGSDSHCTVDMSEELRTLEYGQRLNTRKRAVLGTDSESVGRRLYTGCANGGANAIGIATGKISPGSRADWIVVDDEHASIAGAQTDRLLDRLIFCSTGCPITNRMIGGHWIENDELQIRLSESSREFLELNQRLLG